QHGRGADWAGLSSGRDNFRRRGAQPADASAGTHAATDRSRINHPNVYVGTASPGVPQRAAATAAAAPGWIAKILSNPLMENTSRTLGTSPNSTTLPSTC